MQERTLVFKFAGEVAALSILTVSCFDFFLYLTYHIFRYMLFFRCYQIKILSRVRPDTSDEDTKISKRGISRRLKQTPTFVFPPTLITPFCVLSPVPLLSMPPSLI